MDIVKEIHNTSIHILPLYNYLIYKALQSL